jgi:hypothetical protein
MKRYVAYVAKRSKPAKGEPMKSLTFFTAADKDVSDGRYFFAFNSASFYDLDRIKNEFKHLVEITPPELISSDEKVYINANGSLVIAKKEKPDYDEDARAIGAWIGKHHSGRD